MIRIDLLKIVLALYFTSISLLSCSKKEENKSLKNPPVSNAPTNTAPTNTAPTDTAPTDTTPTDTAPTEKADFCTYEEFKNYYDSLLLDSFSDKSVQQLKSLHSEP